MMNFLTEDLLEHISEVIAITVSRTVADTWYKIHCHSLIIAIRESVRQDFNAFITRDPENYYYRSPLMSHHSPFYAVLLHRIAHHLWIDRDLQGAVSADFKAWALAIHHYSRSRTGVDIHPGASIGRRFVIDHGHGTIIGETAEIGDDAYLLNGVTIGARGIADNTSSKRHPKIGNNVQIGAFSQLLGPIVIGDDVSIDPHSLVLRNVPARSRIRVVRRDHVIDTIESIYTKKSYMPITDDSPSLS